MYVKNIPHKPNSCYLIYLTLFLLIAIISHSQANNSAFTILNSDEKSIDLHVAVPPMNFDKVTIEGKDWDSIEIPNYCTTTEPGAPQLPVIATNISIPWGMNAKTQAIRTENPQVMKGYMVLPNEEFKERFTFNANIYSMDTLYPGSIVKLSQPSGFRDHWVVRVEIYPVQYNPKQSELLVYDSVDISIRYVEDEKYANEPQKIQGPIPLVFQYLYEHHIVNNENAIPLAPSAAGTYLSLLVITPNKFSPQFTPCYGDDPSGTNYNVKWAINTNHEGTVNYFGHGSFSRWASWSYTNESFTVDDVNSLNNGDYTPVVFNVGCEMGIFYGLTSLSEAWVRKSNGGAVGALGAVSITMFTPNSVFDQKLYKYIFEYRWNIGDACLAAIVDSGSPYCHGYTWFGDPLMAIRSLPISAAPPDMTASSGQSEKLGILEDRLLHNYPNPFNPETWIPYSLRDSSDVVIEIYTLDGRLVRNINIGKRPAGDHITKDRAAYWDGCNNQGESVSSGVYFYTLKVNGRHIATKRLVLLK